MVKLTIDLIARGTSGYTKKKRDETMPQYLRRLTHLYLEDKNIDEVGEDLALCRNLIVLYLYDNSLAKIPLLHHNCNLTHLYLQNNGISKIENLSSLTRLTKLYLGGNKITVLEGLEKQEHLQELHFENQHLPPGEKLLFDPRSLRKLAKSLQVLNVSGNNLDSFTDLECLKNLNQLMATDNNLNDMKELAHILGQWTCMCRLELMGNPICHKAKYRDRVIIMSQKLAVLDGKEITETSRQFLRNWHASKETQKKRHDEFIRQGMPTEISELSGLPRKQFDELLAKNRLDDNDLKTFQRANKTRSGVLRTKYSDHYNLFRGISSAPARRPITLTIEVAGSINPTRHVHLTS
ncbi:protein phosphatase 1 regulatory subunit 42-like isoform X3 [Gigantopelta aegis]|uniref:protein phosphatase 1 regulatory subunit 42-like isoform X3 n=1 Tax=Gigantopelta aegis TaxID=1735272 RepID=UPI001B888E05|nr:protein phosphatase 1 regulatory subunit 42-like isoform X3 [Gigantopelta aegis]